MTDSMKFGPEWLRNMSAEPIGTSASSGLQAAHVDPATGSVSHKVAHRNVLAVHRYGREEMLSFFEKDELKSPEILPLCKNLFVEKIQLPLALTPSTEEEHPQATSTAMSRPPWSNRGAAFGMIARGGGRVGLVDRGRARGKSSFSSSYQRIPGGTSYEENAISISSSSKAERPWNERNGSHEPPNSDWNGPASGSPRREYNFGRGVENWRSARTDDTMPVSEFIAASDGWRNNNSSFNSGQPRYGRSTSWRDEDTCSNNENVNSSLIAMQRSPSSSAVGKNNRSTTSGLQWSSRTATLKENTGNVDTDESLPEWAIETPSEIGGCFDASGAFHGSNQSPSSEELTDANLKADIAHDSNDSEKSQTLPSTEEKCMEDANSEMRSNNGDNLQQNRTAIEACNGDTSHSLKNVSSETMVAIQSDKDSELKSPAFKLSETSSTDDISDCFKEVSVAVEKLIAEEDFVSQISNHHINAALHKKSNTDEFLPPVGYQPNTVVPHSQFPIQSEVDYVNSAVLGLQTKSQQIFPSISMPIINQGPLQTGLPEPLLQPPTHMMANHSRDMWYYRDPQANVQGPFTPIEMAEWYRSGYFNESLFVRRFCDSRFRTLGELIKICQGSIPFSNGHLIPTPHELDTMYLDQHFKEEQQQRCVKLAGIANLLIDAIKSNTNALDMSHILHIKLQMLQEQYIHENKQIAMEALAGTEYFRALSPAEREAVILQKVQTVALPDYLRNFSSFSNCLQELCPIAYSHLCTALTEQMKKSQYVADGGGQLAQRSVQHMYAKTNNDFLPANPHILQHPSPHQFLSSSCSQSFSGIENNEIAVGNDHNNFNMRMLLRNNSAGTQPIGVKQQLEFGMAPWLPQCLNQNHCEQHLAVSASALDKQQQHQWGTSPVSVRHATTPSLTPSVDKNILKDATAALWSVPSDLEKREHIQNVSHLHTDSNLNNPEENNSPLKSSTGDELHSQSYIQQSNVPPTENTKEAHQILISETDYKFSVKPLLENSNQPTVEEVNLTVEEGRRSDQDVEEKRRQKEEKRRLQSESEKRRAEISELDKRRQQQEERERQQQIQAHRRKALTGYSAVRLQSSKNASNDKVDREQQLQRGAAPSSSVAPWSLHTTTSSDLPTLAEIQKAERKERRADQQRLQEQLDKQIRANQNCAPFEAASVSKWQSPTATGPVPSLVDIQAEETKRLASEQSRREEKQHQHQQSNNNQHYANQATASNTSNIFLWKNSSKVWSNSLVAGFWDDGPNAVGNEVNEFKQSQVNEQSKEATNSRRLQKSQAQATNSTQNTITAPSSTSGGSALKVQKKSSRQTQEKCKTTSFSKQKSLETSKTKAAEYESEFKNWCMQSLLGMPVNIDVPTFVGFLQDLETPYDVREYVRMYLGETKETSDFAKQFLERRSKYKNLKRAENAHNDDMCKPAPAINPCGTDNSDVKNKQKKTKKHKMTKLDGRILGFSVTAAEGRLNVGDRDYVDGP